MVLMYVGQFKKSLKEDEQSTFRHFLTLFLALCLEIDFSYLETIVG